MGSNNHIIALRVRLQRIQKKIKSNWATTKSGYGSINDFHIISVLLCFTYIGEVAVPSNCDFIGHLLGNYIDNC